MPELEANGVQLSYDVQGEGPPVVMVAGRGMPRGWWSEEHTRPYLDARFSVIRFDNRGMPPSECPPEPFEVDDLVADAAALLDSLDLGPCVVVGHSMGSCIAQELAAGRPDLVRAVAMIATTARHPGWVRVFHRGMIELFESGAEVPAELLVGTLFGQLYNPTQLGDDARVMPFAVWMLELPPWDDPGRVGQWRAYAGYEADLEGLGGIRAPSLVIAAERDLIMPPPLARKVADAIPRCSYVELPDAGHWAVVLDPARVHAIVLEFLGDAGIVP
jgi:pimeloyl-ACP methyl ester carboxylesterase